MRGQREGHSRGPRIWLACLLLSACNSPGAGPSDPVAPAAPPTARGGEQPVAGAPVARPSARRLAWAPAVVRCPGERTHNGCSPAARINLTSGKVRLIHPNASYRREVPVVVDESHVYWPGHAHRKQDLEPLQLAWRSHQVRWLAPGDSTALLVVDVQGVYLLPKDGSKGQPLGSPGDDKWSAASGPSFVAWTSDRGGVPPRSEVVVARRDGTIVQRVAEPGAYGARVFDDRLYWYNHGLQDGTIRTLRGGRGITLATDLEVPRDLTVFGDHVYWVTDEKEGRVVSRAPLSGGTAQRLGVSHELRGHRSNQDRILVHQGHVYWNAAHSVVRVPVDGGEAEIVVTADIPGDIHSFAMDDTDLYLTARIPATTPPNP